MALTALAPERVERLVAIDIAPLTTMFAATMRFLRQSMP